MSGKAGSSFLLKYLKRILAFNIKSLHFVFIISQGDKFPSSSMETPLNLPVYASATQRGPVTCAMTGEAGKPETVRGEVTKRSASRRAQGPPPRGNGEQVLTQVSSWPAGSEPTLLPQPRCCPPRRPNHQRSSHLAIATSSWEKPLESQTDEVLNGASAEGRLFWASRQKVPPTV